jgi:hypothetical protein
LRRILRRARPLIIVLLIAVVVLLFLTNLRFARQSPGGNAFLARWVGARAFVFDGESPYAREVMLRAQGRIYGRAADLEAGEDPAAYLYPLPSIVIYLPFAFLPFEWARALWMTLLEISLPLSTILAARILRWKPPLLTFGSLLVFSVVWFPGLETVVTGGFGGLLVSIIAGSLLAVHDGQDGLGGVLLACTLVVPWATGPFVLFVLLWGLSRRRWNLLLAFTGSFGAWSALAFLLRRDWVWLWLVQLVNYLKATDLGSPLMLMLRALSDAWRLPVLGVTLGLGAYLLLEWRQAWGKRERWAVWTGLLTITLGGLLTWQSGLTAQVALLPVITFMLATWDSRWGRAGRLAGILFLLVLSLGMWSLFPLIPRSSLTDAGASFAVSLLCAVGLWWVRWWVTRPPYPLLDER